MIGTNAFQSCSDLRCIYYYGAAAPTVYSNAFAGVLATTVMTTSSYQSTEFGSLNVPKGTVSTCYRKLILLLITKFIFQYRLDLW